MEFANHWRSRGAAPERRRLALRTATRADAATISRLLQNTSKSHFHVDWRLPADWLGSPHFVLVPQPDSTNSGKLRSRFLTLPEQAWGCLAATPDPLPAAWVRVAAVAMDQDEADLLALMLTAVEDSLRATAVSQLGWLVSQPWPLRHLPGLGFSQTNEIETYLKEGLALPQLPPRPDLHIRPVAPPDYAALVALEADAFEPLWRYGAETLALARQEALGFDVAERDGRLVGYQISSGGPEGAHLVRMTIAREAQGQGIGSALLATAVQSYRRLGYQRVTLNTQVDNVGSQRLYRKFGFQATGSRLPVWSKWL